MVTDPFEILGIEPRFQLSKSELEARQRALSAEVHPDRFQGGSKGQRRVALGAAIEVNAAIRILKDPVARGEALLSRLLGRPVTERDAPPAAPELLMEMMELRESLRDASRARDTAQIQALIDAATVSERQVTQDLEQGFSSALESPPGDAQRIHQGLSTLRYYRRFFDEAGAILDEL